MHFDIAANNYIKKIVKDKKHKAILRKGYQQKELNLFSWQKKTIVYKGQKFELHCTEKMPIKKMGVSTRRKKEKKKMLVHTFLNF